MHLHSPIYSPKGYGLETLIQKRLEYGSARRSGYEMVRPREYGWGWRSGSRLSKPMESPKEMRRG
jgi:hypothetical protein